MAKCPWCDYLNEDVKNSLRIHASKLHKKSSKELKEALGILPEPFLCLCGCGEYTKPNKCGGYNRFIIGHANRVNNNWGHNLAARRKSIQTRRENGTLGFKDGNVPWNFGLTKNDDERVMRQSECMKKVHGERYSKLMTHNRLTRIVPNLTGSSHPQWKGGTSPIDALCHGSNRLYREWKYPALHRAGFKCQRCGSSDDLHVHHNDVRMASIIKICQPEGLVDREATWEETVSWVERVVDWHLENEPSSEVLCEGCHAEEHPSLNFSSRE